MKIINRFFNLLSSIEDGFIFIIFLLFFLIGFYGMYDSYMVYQSANDNSILQFKPGYESEEPIEKEIQGNMVSWLSIDDTNIDYPVMQGDTNNEYLNKNPYGEYAMSGSIFLDCRNSSDFTDDYSLVYGHHMEGGYMFGALDEYFKKSYFEKHKTGKLIVKDKEYTIEIFSVLEADAREESIFAPTEIRKENVLDYIQRHSMYIDNERLELAKQYPIFAMSTCQSPESMNRTIIIGALVP